MYLKQLIINGFKSFADKTRVELRPGIVAIVGPNGCGKSNIVDAIRWVLGEQSAKALRGGNMHDVIFSGTDKRKPLQFCEVELVFADCENELGTAFHEVSILRRVSRDDASDYFLNGKACRLKDIQRLFMDTGVGRVSYSFMVQGQIDQVLSANPAERRALFEEAAGITRYKNQRKEALGKLDLVEQNLARVNDLLDELTRQINSLKRQAAKALRYKRLNHRLIHLDLADKTYQFTQHRAAVAALADTSGTLRAQVQNQQNALAEREQILANFKNQRGELQTRIDEQQQAIFATRSAKESTESNIKYSQSRIQDLRERNLGIEQEISAIRAQQTDLENRIAGGGNKRNEAGGNVDSAEANFRSAQAKFEQANAELAQVENQLSRERQQLFAAENEITRSRTSVTSIEVNLRASEMHQTELANRVAQLTEERENLRSRHEEAQNLAATRTENLAKVRSETEALRERTKTLLAEFRVAQQKITQIDRQVAQTNAQITMLRQLQAKFEGFSAGAKAVLQGQLGEIVPAGTAKTINSLIKIRDKNLMSVAETLLVAANDAIFLKAGTKIDAVLEKFAERDFDRAALIFPEISEISEHSENSENSENRVPANLPDFLVPANSIFSLKDDDFCVPVKRIFARCFVAETLEQFLDFWRERPDFDFLFVATHANELIDCRGILHTAAKQNKSGSTFQREAEIAALTERLQNENEVLTSANEAAMAIQAQMTENDEKIEQSRSRSATLAQEISAIQADERNAARALQNHDFEIQKQTRALENFKLERSRALEKMEAAKRTLESGESTIVALKNAIAEHEIASKNLRENVDAARERANEFRFELAQKKQELALIEKEVAAIRTQLADMKFRLETRGNELKNNQNQLDSYEKQIALDNEKVQQLSTKLAEENAQLEVIRADFKNAETKIADLENSMTSERNALRERENELKNCEIQLSNETLLCKNLSEKIEQDYQLDIASIDWQQELKTADEIVESKVNLSELEEEKSVPEKSVPEENANSNSSNFSNSSNSSNFSNFSNFSNPDWPILRREILELRERLHAIGAINHNAIEEYSDVRERHNFTKKQFDDLWAAKSELIKAIDEINATSQKLFTETFEQIRKNFAFTFQRLFHGGESDLQLVQANDVLESGIEIIARPPGTKLRGISLLSGGQRTMTAVALLFAIYMVKPSPFCVLDELDAPLDDANVGRFTDIVKEFTKYSQFLVVTHNKRTVAAANMIYGVTMQERGVTQLLSMKFSQATGTANAGTPTLGHGGTFSMAR